MTTLYDFTVDDIHGKPVKLDRYKGKVLLIVNTASKCGFTPQYKGLEALYEKYHGKGLEVLGFPCNQFGAQEPGNEEEIASFCELNYDVTFPMFAKVDVNGDSAAPLYEYLKAAKPGIARQRGDQVELHQVPGRPRRQRRRALRAQRHAGVDRARRRKGAVMRPRTIVAGRRLALAIAIAAGVRCALAQADPAKILRVSFPIAETGFDPQAAGDVYSNYVNRAIFDPLYRYDYLARPYKLVPNTAAAMPEISADGLTWTIKIKPGIYFADDPAFKGKKRELDRRRLRLLDGSASSIRRCARTRCRRVDGRFVGADAIVAKAKETGKFDYDAPIEGLAGARPLHDPLQAQLPRLRAAGQPDDDAARRPSRAR